MANEFNANSQLSINDALSASLPFSRNYGKSNTVSMEATAPKGPTPGVVVATTSGVSVSLASLTYPGMCWLENLSPDYAAYVGIRDTSTGAFYPLLELPPGYGQHVRLCPLVGREMTDGAGTGTAGSGATLYIKGVGGTANVSVEAWER